MCTVNYLSVFRVTYDNLGEHRGGVYLANGMVVRKGLRTTDIDYPFIFPMAIIIKETGRYWSSGS